MEIFSDVEIMKLGLLLVESLLLWLAVMVWIELCNDICCYHIIMILSPSTKNVNWTCAYECRRKQKCMIYGDFRSFSRRRMVAFRKWRFTFEKAFRNTVEIAY